MSGSGTDSPSTDYYSASSRSRSASVTSRVSDVAACLAPISNDGGRCTIGVSNNVKREYKDKRIYVNHRTGLPVRPPTSFGLFKHALRRKLKGNKLSFQEFNQKATSKWLKMRDEDKDPYVQRAKQLAEQFKKVEVSFLRKKVRQLQQQMEEDY